MASLLCAPLDHPQHTSFFIAADAGGGSYRVRWLFSDTHTPPPLRALNTFSLKKPFPTRFSAGHNARHSATMNNVLLPTIRVWRNKDGGSGVIPSALMDALGTIARMGKSAP